MFTAAFLLYGLYESFGPPRNFTELQFAAVPVMIVIAAAQFGELLPQFGIWRWLLISTFKAALCLLFVALAYSWIHEKTHDPGWSLHVLPTFVEDFGGNNIETEPTSSVSFDFASIPQQEVGDSGFFQNIKARLVTLESKSET
jgi:hypothetical protein